MIAVIRGTATRRTATRGTATRRTAIRRTAIRTEKPCPVLYDRSCLTIVGPPNTNAV